MNEDILWVIKIIGILAAGIFISHSTQIGYQTKNTEATVYQPKTYEQVILLK
jgi:hypothetical protein